MDDERLSALNDLGEFVIEVLKTVEEVTGAAVSTVFLYNDHTRTATRACHGAGR
jgi:hypothetical protein